MIYQMHDLRTEDNPKEKHEAEAQVNLFQKHSFLNQLTHNMTTDCSLITYWLQYKKNTKYGDAVYKHCFECQNKNKKQFLYTICSELVFFL